MTSPSPRPGTGHERHPRARKQGALAPRFRTVGWFGSLRSDRLPVEPDLFDVPERLEGHVGREGGGPVVLQLRHVDLVAGANHRVDEELLLAGELPLPVVDAD